MSVRKSMSAARPRSGSTVEPAAGLKRRQQRICDAETVTVKKMFTGQQRMQCSACRVFQPCHTSKRGDLQACMALAKHTVKTTHKSTPTWAVVEHAVGPA
jgi:hypothetical protein